MRRIILLCLAGLALVAAGCGSDDDDSSTGSTGSAAATAPAETTETETEAAPEAEAEAGGDETDLTAKPTITPPDAEPPAKLETRDIVVGDGKKAKAGDVVSVDYVGVLYDDGKQFDASWDRGEPIQFQLGVGQVIPGWDEGIAGMKVGGRRELIIPPDMAYGPAGAPPDIPPNSTLIFVADLKDVG